eukprot:RCo027326
MASGGLSHAVLPQRHRVRPFADENGEDGVGDNQLEEKESTKTGLALPPEAPVIRAQSNYEFLDHTADVQIHSWGVVVEEAFEFAALAMFDYMTERRTVDIDESCTYDFTVNGHDWESLLFAFMDEVLYHFHGDGVAARELKVTQLDRENFTISARGWGEKFNLAKHPQGTEIKAITFSNMQIWEKDDRTDIFVIVDI